jgi:glycosyltransferase involved in cell wall biosynthesis
MKNSLTILHVIPTLEIGGAERQLILLAMEQARQGNAVHIAMRRVGEFSKLIDREFVSIHVIGDYTGLHPLLFLRLQRLIGVLSPDIVQSWLTQMDIVGGILAKINGVPWVATERSSPGRYLKTRGMLKNFLRRVVMAFSSVIVANSASGAQMWKKKLPRSHVVCIGNAIDHAGIADRVNSKSRCFPKANNVLMVGRFLESKGFFEVLSAGLKFPIDVNLTFTLIGSGSPGFNLASQIKKYDGLGSLTVIQNKGEWWSHLVNAKMLITMSRFEGHPNVLLEAVASGCPVIVSDIPAHREVLCEDAAIFVPLDDEVMLIEAIRNVMVDYSSALKRADRARSRVLNMNSENMEKLYKSVYSEILDCRA